MELLDEPLEELELLVELLVELLEYIQSGTELLFLLLLHAAKHTVTAMKDNNEMINFFIHFSLFKSTVLWGI